MNPAIAEIPLLRDLYESGILLLVVNALLTGLAVLLAWRCHYWRLRCEEMEEKLAAARGLSSHAQVLPRPVVPPPPNPQDLRRIPPLKFPKRDD